MMKFTNVYYVFLLFCVINIFHLAMTDETNESIAVNTTTNPPKKPKIKKVEVISDDDVKDFLDAFDENNSKLTCENYIQYCNESDTDIANVDICEIIYKGLLCTDINDYDDVRKIMRKIRKYSTEFY